MSITRVHTLSTSSTSAPNAAATGSQDDDTVIVASRLLGPLPVPRTELFTAPAGLYGFETCGRWALVPAGRDGLWWLQSVESEELVFLLADPFGFFVDYAVDVPPTELAPLGATEATPLMALVIVTLPAGERDAPTANLRAPILIEPAARVMRQFVMADEALSLTAPITI